MKRLFTISKNSRMFLLVSIMFFLGIQVRVIAQDIDFNSTACAGGSVAGYIKFNKTGTIKAIACNTCGCNIKSMQLVNVIDNVSVVCTSCSSGTTVHGINFPASNNTSSYAITGSIIGDGVDHLITFTLKATEDNAAQTSQQQTYTMHITSAGGWGDPHLTTADGLHYDFQSAGEFVALRGDSGENFEIQTRHTPVSTSGPGMASNNTTGLTTCVSIITAVAARVGTHRVTYQQNISGVPDPSGMQLWVDDTQTTLTDNGIDLKSGGRISRLLKTSTGRDSVIEIDFPEGASLIISSNWWDAYKVWYLNVSMYNTMATNGIMGIVPPLNFDGNLSQRSGRQLPSSIGQAKSWLPALPDGTSVGAMPTGLHDRFVILYGKFADAWRVTDSTSLFHYAAGTSTATFTNKNWPTENAQSCVIPGKTAQSPIGLAVAQQLCQNIIDPDLKADAIFDVMVTGDSGFVKSYLVTERVKASSTGTTLKVSKDTTKYEEPVTLTATVYRKFSALKDILTGSVEFTADGEKIGQVKLEANGIATLITTSLKAGKRQIVATFIPDSGSTVFSSSSVEITHIVIGGMIGGILHQWWFWLILVILLLIIIFSLRKKKP